MKDSTSNNVPIDEQHEVFKAREDLMGRQTKREETWEDLHQNTHEEHESGAKFDCDIESTMLDEHMVWGDRPTVAKDRGQYWQILGSKFLEAKNI